MPQNGVGDGAKGVQGLNSVGRRVLMKFDELTREETAAVKALLEVTPEEISAVKSKLGEGSFGVVHHVLYTQRGQTKGLDAARKQLRLDSASELKAFKEEATILIAAQMQYCINIFKANLPCRFSTEAFTADSAYLHYYLHTLYVDSQLVTAAASSSSSSSSCR